MALPTSEGSTDTQIRQVRKGRLSPEGSRVPLETSLAMGRVPSQRSEYLTPVAWLFSFGHSPFFVAHLGHILDRKVSTNLLEYLTPVAWLFSFGHSPLFGAHLGHILNREVSTNLFLHDSLT